MEEKLQEFIGEEVTYFKEYNEVLSLIGNLISESSEDEVVLHRQSEEIIHIFDKYQEQNHLLDKYLNNLVTPLMGYIQGEVRRGHAVWHEGAKNRSLSKDLREKIASRKLPFVCSIIYTLCKVRGYKRILKYLSHKVTDLEPCFIYLQSLDSKDMSSWQTRYVLLLWLSILLMSPFDLSSVDSSTGQAATSSSSTLVESILVLCKLHLEDSGRCSEAGAVCLARLLTRPDRINTHLGTFLTWCIERLKNLTSGNKAAGEGGTLSSSLAESNQALLPEEVILVSGLLSALIEVFKHGHRDQLLPFSMQLLECIISLALRPGGIRSTVEKRLTLKLLQKIGLCYLPHRVAKWRYTVSRRSILENLSAATTLGSTEAPSGGETFADEEEEGGAVDYSPIEPLIEILLGGLRDRDTVVRWSAAKGVGKLANRLPKALGDDVVSVVLELFSEHETEAAWQGGCMCVAELARRGLLLPSRLPTVIPLLLRALIYDVQRGQHSVGSNVRDAACYVAWAFARAYHPTVLRPHIEDLPKQLVVACLLDREVNCRRAASAAFQECVGRQGVVSFPSGLEILALADFYAVGNCAACYTSLAPTIAIKYPYYSAALIHHLVEVKLGHWDEAVRVRASRSLGAMTKGYAGLFVSSIIPHLLTNCTSSNVLVRHGSIISLAECVLGMPSEADEVSDKIKTIKDKILGVIPKLEADHLYRGKGGELIRKAACKLVQCILLSSWLQKGAEISEEMRLQFLHAIEDGLRHSREDIQSSAAAAFESFCEIYLIPPSSFQKKLSDTIQQVYIKGLLSDSNPATRRGYALCIGRVSSSYLLAVAESDAGALERVFLSLFQACSGWSGHPSPTGAPRHVEKHPEARRNAIISLCELAVKLWTGCNPLGSQSRLQGGLLQEVLRTAVNAITLGCRDYDVDDRGDVGSMVRRAGLSGAQHLFSTVVQSLKSSSLPYRGAICELVGLFGCQFPFDNMRTSLMFLIVQSALMQFGDKLETVRESAGKALESIVVLMSESALLIDKHAEKDKANAMMREIHERMLHNHVDIVSIFNSTATHSVHSHEDVGINYKTPAAVYPLLVQYLRLESYAECVLEGLILSIGSLTQSVSGAASQALVQWFHAQEEHSITAPSQPVIRLGALIVDILQREGSKDRVAIPALKCLSLCIEHHLLPYYCLDAFKVNHASRWIHRLCEIVMAGCRHSTDMPRLVSSLHAYHSLLLGVDLDAIHLGLCELLELVLPSMLLFLGHPFPRLRVMAAESLVLFFLSVEDDEKRNQELLLKKSCALQPLLDIVRSTDWVSDLSYVRSQRDWLSKMVRIDFAKVEMGPLTEGGVQKQLANSASTYAAFVNNL